MSKMTLAKMAREIERRRPGVLPKSICRSCLGAHYDGHIETRHVCLNLTDHPLNGPMPKDLAGAILRDAMVMALVCVERDWSTYDRRWSVMVNHERKHFRDANHGNCPTRSLFAAFCAVFPEPTP